VRPNLNAREFSDHTAIEARPKRKNTNAMQIDQAEIFSQLKCIVRSVTRDCELFEDLLQEAYMHLWQKLLQSPGQTRSWYLQSCRFHLLHLINAGSSLDAVKRRHARCDVDNEQQALEREIQETGVTNPVFNHVSTNDALEQLFIRLTPLQQEIFILSYTGFGLRETARLIGISHQAVGNHRRIIAEIATQLGLSAQSNALEPAPSEILDVHA
jgi:RNA polymerase sigma factor (sigma-70 family)